MLSTREVTFTRLCRFFSEARRSGFFSSETSSFLSASFSTASGFICTCSRQKLVQDTGLIYYYCTVWRIRDVYPGSRILIFTHPGFQIPDPGSRIPDIKTATKERGENFTKIEHYFSFEKLKKKIWVNFQRIV
jgi:hypothetical protein